MNRYVPLIKQTKKQQKAYHSAQRNSWGAVRPVTRIAENRKAYDRARSKRDCIERRNARSDDE